MPRRNVELGQQYQDCCGIEVSRISAIARRVISTTGASFVLTFTLLILWIEAALALSQITVSQDAELPLRQISASRFFRD